MKKPDFIFRFCVLEDIYMKLILLKDVKGLGKVNDVVDVNDGYGRNFLIARGLAVLNTDTSKKILKKP